MFSSGRDTPPSVGRERIFCGLGNDEYRPFFGLEICLRKILPQYTDAKKAEHPKQRG